MKVALAALGCSPAAVCGPPTELVHREDTGGEWEEAAAASSKYWTITKWSIASMLQVIFPLLGWFAVPAVYSKY